MRLKITGFCFDPQKLLVELEQEIEFAILSIRELDFGIGQDFKKNGGPGGRFQFGMNMMDRKRGPGFEPPAAKEELRSRKSRGGDTKGRLMGFDVAEIFQKCEAMKFPAEAKKNFGFVVGIRLKKLCESGAGLHTSPDFLKNHAQEGVMMSEHQGNWKNGGVFRSMVLRIAQGQVFLLKKDCKGEWDLWDGRERRRFGKNSAFLDARRCFLVRQGRLQVVFPGEGMRFLVFNRERGQTRVFMQKCGNFLQGCGNLLKQGASTICIHEFGD